MNVIVDNGKYEVCIEDDGRLFAKRHGEYWRDCLGDKLIYNLAYELQEAREEIAKLSKEK